MLNRIEKRLLKTYLTVILPSVIVLLIATAMIGGCGEVSGDNKKAAQSTSYKNIYKVEVDGCEYIIYDGNGITKADCDCKPNKK